ncbi:MAG: hypothetical protein WBA57_21360 [Elainellaceae cyanobacterium]
MNMAATSTSWATLKYGPTEPKSSRGYTPQHSACVQLIDRQSEEAWIYFNEGIYSYLMEGDTFICTWKKGKWRLDTLTPELQAKLNERMQAAQAYSPTNAPQAQAFNHANIPNNPPAPEPPDHPPDRQPRSEVTNGQLKTMHQDAKTYSTLMLSIQAELIRGATLQSGELGINASQLEAYAIAIFNRVTR